MVYNGSTYDGKAIASPSVESRKYKNRKANAIKTEIEVVSIFNFIKIFLKKLKIFFYEIKFNIKTIQHGYLYNTRN